MSQATSTSRPARRGLLLVISGPSGVGKSTITRRVLEQLGAELSISVTTRPSSDQDTVGKRYEFVSVEEFRRRREAGYFLESAEVFGNCYGTPREPVLRAIAQGRTILLEIDVQGAIQVKKNLAGQPMLGVFILPPTPRTLLERLRSRGREDEATIQKRFSRAQAEMAQARVCGVYDAFVVNDQLERAVAETLGVVRTRLAGA
ncbi:MAG: guanylate kinase [Phycisphaeraceae bacterium]|nr:guanylate kinase [Phycisphaeraceae bacterium]